MEIFLLNKITVFILFIGLLPDLWIRFLLSFLDLV